MSIPDFQSLMLPVLLIPGGEEIRFGDAVAKLAEQLSLTLMSGRSYCHLAGKLFSEIGHIGRKRTLVKPACLKARGMAILKSLPLGGK